jgi:8-amino-7-oxononanoate synthase
MTHWGAWVDSELDAVRQAGRWRQLRTLDGGGPSFGLADGRQVVSFASNDYLGLSQHPLVVAAAKQALDRWGAGSGASRLIVGSRPIHADLEAAIADWRGTDGALVLPTGYAANLGVLTTFGDRARIVSDALNHASIIDGARLARAEVCVYQHGDVDEAAALVKSAPGRVLVVTDTVFSMDGDLAPIAELSSLCARTGALLVVDDAHLVFGGPLLDPDAACVRVGTLSKTLGSLGGYVTGPASFIDLLVNRARPFIFTTAPTPAAAAAALAALGIVRGPSGEALRARLRHHIDALLPGHPSPIIPVIVGDEQRSLDAAAALLEEGLLVPAIRPPTVPPGTSRLRVALSAAHTDEQVTRLRSALAALIGGGGPVAGEAAAPGVLSAAAAGVAPGTGVAPA